MTLQIRPVREFVSQNSPEVQFDPIPNQCHVTPQTGQVKNLVVDFLKVHLFFIVSYAILKDLFGGKFTGRKFHR